MDLKDKLVTFLKHEVLEDTTAVIHEDDALLISGMIDSLSLMRIVRYIEKQLHVTVPFEDITLENFNTVKNIVAYTKKFSN